MVRNFLLLFVLAISSQVCLAATTLKQIEVDGAPTSIVLPENTSTPDGMTVAKDGKIYLSMLNLQVPAQPAVWTVDADNQLQKLIDLPKHPETDGVFPLGIAQGKDGNLYVADNQTFGANNAHQSRLLRVVMKDDKAVRVETVATGLIAANAVEAHGKRIYVTETCLINDAKPHVSGLYKFELDELSADNPVQLEPDGADPRLVAKFTTEADDWRSDIGANGLAISPQGVLYVCNFGEASILTAPLKEDGFLAEPLKVLVKGDGIGSTDGMKYVPAIKKLVVADFFSNAIHLVSPRTGRVKTVAQNPNSDGAGGKLDKPSEPCVRGTTLYASNIDLPYDGNEPDKPDSLTVIQLKITE
ncbi:NHL repeat protein [Planctomycetes bacterium CA13]|uniref:NHL repeat protein n=1 Tax=Novipirellula herctigrandis TaxID=2527986 RepID=A0A5C5YYY5_9BACT|nr:NHL repeat protein [Planctomycetes bacterium CA13]